MNYLKKQISGYLELFGWSWSSNGYMCLAVDLTLFGKIVVFITVGIPLAILTTLLLLLFMPVGIFFFKFK